MEEKEIIALIADVEALDEDKDTTLEYLTALKARDMERVKWFLSFGKDARHAVMNVHEYRKAMFFGLEHTGFDEYGWITYMDFPHVEEVSFALPKERFGNNITLHRSPNGKWVYGADWRYGEGGRGWGGSVFDKPFASREACLNHAIKEMQKYFEGILKSKRSKQDVSYIQRVMKMVSEKMPDKVQLELF